MTLEERLDRFEECLRFFADEHEIYTPSNKLTDKVFKGGYRILKGIPMSEELHEHLRRVKYDS